jgi:hypothetical protein
LGVTTQPTATYPLGATGRHTAIVPSGFFRAREPLSAQMRVKPAAGAVGGSEVELREAGDAMSTTSASSGAWKEGTSM